eukprot:m.13565 g.13565  ORF g.13565 m.13565 type:complete len:69 (+) comp5959_c0_seq1:162-368(+)
MSMLGFCLQPKLTTPGLGAVHMYLVVLVTFLFTLALLPSLSAVVCAFVYSLDPTLPPILLPPSYEWSR